MKWQPKKLTREQMAERRAEGVRLLQAGEMSQAQIARHLGVTEAAVSKWKKTLVRQGPEALKARKAPGRPSKLSAEQRTQLVNILQQGARAAGFPTEQWTLARVKQVIKKHFEVDYHRNYLSRLLHGLSWSVQKPEPRALERDEELIRAWLQQDWPRIKKDCHGNVKGRMRNGLFHSKMVKLNRTQCPDCLINPYRPSWTHQALT